MRLDNFEGPFDLLLSLITRRQLDITEVALSQVTDEFITYISGAAKWDLGQATEFLVVAATLLDLKTARLLPAGDVEDEEDLALLEARDLLFARLLQYRAYKLAAAYLGELERAQGRRYGRSVELEPRFAELLPDVFIGLSIKQFADLAAIALTTAAGADRVGRPRARAAGERARADDHPAGPAAARRGSDLPCAGRRLHSTLEVVGRFLALLELYREGVLAFDQAAALAELRVRWTGGEPVDEAMPGSTPMTSSVDEEYG